MGGRGGCLKVGGEKVVKNVEKAAKFLVENLLVTPDGFFHYTYFACEFNNALDDVYEMISDISDSTLALL